MIWNIFKWLMAIGILWGVWLIFISAIVISVYVDSNAKEINYDDVSVEISRNID